MTKKLLHVTALAIACSSMLGTGESRAATTDTCGPDVVPVVLTGEPKATGYIQPVCSKCKRITVERETTSTGQTHGILELTYHDELYGVFDGTIVLTLLMSDDAERVVTLDDVHLVEGQTARWLVDAGSHTDWADVDMVWLELLPNQ
jgi:hypothetical protein